MVKSKLCESFKEFWINKRLDIVSKHESKLENYFNLKSDFVQEKYLTIKDFHVRRAICKLRISAHDLRIEKDRYSKKYIERTERKCRYCLTKNVNAIEDEMHFIVDCPLYDTERKLFFNKVNDFCSNFKNLSNNAKYFWLFTNENLPTLTCLGNFIIHNLETRSNWKQSTIANVI